MSGVSPSRSLLVAVIALAHVAAFATSLSGVAERVTARPAIVVHDIAAPSIAEPPVPRLALAAIPVDVAAPTVDIAGEQPAPGGCDLATALQAALASDAAVGRALAAVPAESRSVANAVMVWDGRWAGAAALGGTAEANPIRAIVVDRILAAAPGCREVEVTGPRLMTVGGAGRPVALAFGSGVWRWADLL